MLKKFISHTFIYGLSNQIPKIAGILALPLITRDLSENDYGIYGVVIAYSSSIEIFATLGMRVSFINTFYKGGVHFKKFWNHLFAFLITWRIPYTVLHFSIIYAILPDEVANKALTAILSVGASALFGPISVMGTVYYQLKEKPRVVGSLGILGGIVTVLLNVFFISVLKLGYLGFLWSTLCGGLLVNILYTYLIAGELGLRPNFPFNWKFVKRSLSLALPTIPHFYSMFLLNTSDRIIMNQMGVKTDDIGKYNVSYTVGNIFQSIAMASGFAITPLMMRCYKENNERLARRLVFFLQAIFLVATFVACIWMREIFALLIKNEGLSQMYYLSVIIVMSFNYRPIYYGAVNKLIYLEKTRVLWRLTFIPGLLNLILNLIFIPIYGYEFAVISTFVSFALVGMLGYFQKDYIANRSLPYYPVLWTALNVVLTVAAYILKDVDLPWKISFTVVTAVGVLWIYLQLKKLGRMINL